MTQPDCIFCKIVSGQIPVKRLAEDEWGLAFPDANPQAPTHLLVVPKDHHASLAEVPAEEEALLGRLLSLVQRTAAQLGLAERGYRVVVNTGAESGQTVFHLHLHLLAGRPMRWPPG